MGTRDEAIASAKQSVIAGQDQALNDGLGACYDQGLADAGGQTTTPGSFTQADIDAAVAAAQAVDAQALADAKTAADAALADIQSKLDDVTGKAKADEDLIEGMKDSADKLQAAVDLIHSLFPALPVPPTDGSGDQPPVGTTSKR